ncbi:MAG: response regulator [Candidatus Krumholzibacteriia bacterium]
MKTVFLIDDDGLMRKMLARLLEKEKCRVKTFASPIGVLDRMADDRPELIISDVQMPGMSGLQFAESARVAGYRVPVILMTGFMGPDVVEQARGLGVSHIFQKPIKDLSRFRLLVRQVLDEPAATGGGTDLDRLRAEFLTEMSHELRTPLTAIKLALDGLFVERSAGLDAAQSRLLGISRRNVNRIIRMVEKQLDLLQITLGDVSVARRLVNLRRLVESTPRKGHDAETAPPDGDLYLFTDPERLRTVIQCLLEVGGATRPAYEIHGEGGDVVVEFAGDGSSIPGSPGRGDAGKRTDNPACGGTREFEFRACRHLVESLGGTMDVGDGVRLRLPVLPAYDRTADFVFPVRSLRRAAELSDKRISFFRCEVGGNGSGPSGPGAQSFLKRCARALSEGDVLVRGEHGGLYYLALVEREGDEAGDIVEFLRRGDEAGDGAPVRLQSLPEGDPSVDDYVPIPEVVT